MIPCTCPNRCQRHVLTYCRCGHFSLQHGREQPCACEVEGCSCEEFVDREYPEAVAQACSQVLSSEECQKIRRMLTLKQAIDYAFRALEVVGENPGKFLASEGIIQFNN